MSDWEQHYLDEDTPWDKGAPSPALVDFLARQSLGGRVIAPGCGLGHDVRAIAAANLEAEVIGLDVAPTAVESADEFPKASSEKFLVGDWFNLSDELVGTCDWIWEHTCFCAIDPNLRDAYVQAAKRALKPSGQLLGVFYLNPYDEEHAEGADEPPYGSSIEELERRFSPEFEILESWTPERAYSGREGRERVILMRLRG
ncbi:MAG: SAM-dependent methyltransferase [Verrucomicrobiales bacterium]|jgi:SAM-dependent methyltransferase